MGCIRSFTPVQLIVGVLSVSPDFHGRLISRMEHSFGSVKMVTDPVPFTFTHYYDSEMGATPQRFFIVFESLINPERLAQCKLETNRIETEFLHDGGGRSINLDPGILSSENFILATTKHRGHRIPLSEGIYGEITLIYRDHSFRSLPWTYADYASSDFILLFNKLREQYRNEVK